MPAMVSSGLAALWHPPDVGCARWAQPLRNLRNPEPFGGAPACRGQDGTVLLLRHWPAAEGDAWASILLVHGLAEHCGRYDRVKGSSLGPASTSTASTSAALAAREVRAPRSTAGRSSMTTSRSGSPCGRSRRPLVLLGHSMGGLVALGYVLDGRARPDLLILSAPAISARIPLWQRALDGTLRRIAPGTCSIACIRTTSRAWRQWGEVRRGSPEPPQVDRALRPRGVCRAAPGRRFARPPVDADACRPRRRRRDRANHRERAAGGPTRRHLRRSTRASATSSTTR